jgi:hypothetical protein
MGADDVQHAAGAVCIRALEGGEGEGSRPR